MNTKKHFTPNIEAALRASGWTPDRKLLLEELRPWCAIRAGLTPLIIFSAAYDFLKEFGGLKIDLGFCGFSRFFHCDPLETLEIDESWFSYGWIVGLPLYPIGILHHERDIDNATSIAIDTSGKFQAFVLGQSYFLGNDVYEAMEQLASPKLKEEFDWVSERADEVDQVWKIVVQQPRRI